MASKQSKWTLTEENEKRKGKGKGNTEEIHS